MRTAEHDSSRFHAVTDYAAVAMVAAGRKGVNGTFERVKIMGDPVHNDFDSLIILVAADLTLNSGVFARING